MAIEIFNRYEKKYLLDAGAYQELQSRLSEHMELEYEQSGPPGI